MLRPLLLATEGVEGCSEDVFRWVIGGARVGDVVRLVDVVIGGLSVGVFARWSDD